MKKFITPTMVIQYLSFIFVFIRICEGKTICNSSTEVHPSCGIPLGCQETCPNPNEPLPLCSNVCVNECSCADGYVRNGIGGPCILRSDCPLIQKICNSSTEVHPSCGIPLACQETCPNPNEPLSLCSNVCVDECSCADGYVRNGIGGPCILRSDCPPIQSTEIVCRSPEEVHLNCSKLLECQDYCNSNAYEPLVCPAICVDGCSCADGYIRETIGGACILSSQCPPIQVCRSPQEVRLSCGKPLECQDYCNADGPITCTKNCVDGCSCADGYIRSTVGGPCVLISECSSN